MRGKRRQEEEREKTRNLTDGNVNERGDIREGKKRVWLASLYSS